MDDIPIPVLIFILVALIFLSAFFSGSETAMMALNRYRLRHLAQENNPAAIRVQNLLTRPDRLLGLILFGNNLINVMAASLVTLIAIRLYGEASVLLGSLIFTVVLMIFAEVAPKTLAARYPEKIAFPASVVLNFLLHILGPIVFVVNTIANAFLSIIGGNKEQDSNEQLSRDELKSVVKGSSGILTQKFKQMLVGVLELDLVTVEDILVPVADIYGVNFDDDIGDIMDRILSSTHTRIPVYHGEIENIIGILHTRKLITGLMDRSFDKDDLKILFEEPYFIPESIPLNIQLRNFQQQKQRIALVVNEYGELRGLVTLEDLLEEIVGQYTSDPVGDASPDVITQTDGSYLVYGSAYIRELNRSLKWELPTDGPKTINGLVLEYLEHIPEQGTSILINDYPIEIVQSSENAVKKVRIQKRLHPKH